MKISRREFLAGTTALTVLAIAPIAAAVAVSSDPPFMTITEYKAMLSHDSLPPLWRDQNGMLVERPGDWVLVDKWFVTDDVTSMGHGWVRMLRSTTKVDHRGNVPLLTIDDDGIWYVAPDGSRCNDPFYV